ncbi:MAG: glycosyltransferase [Gemmataceae bacterium]|nr:glycosyltransferase [Gemmata sp.]MDW8198385.1 glycosyltransferase [Gemmataceae bacterium]
MAERSPLVVFSDDWGRHPSSCQHLIRHLLPQRPVVWVNTIGTRPPRFNWSTVVRGCGKLRSWLWPANGQHTSWNCLPPSAPELVPPPRVLNPKMWPSFRSRLGRSLNRHLLRRALGPVVDSFPVAPIIVTTIPVVADLVGEIRAARWVYYCVDDFSLWPGLDSRTLQQMEAELVPKVNTVIAVSETLQAHIARLGQAAHLLTHGVDVAFWQTANSDTARSLAEIDALPRPLVVYWGVIDRRLDVRFVATLADTMTAGTILLVGPRDEPDPALVRLPRVRLLPPRPLTDLPALAQRAGALIAPYADSPVTRALQPLKLKEYLATGKPVIARRLPATLTWADAADIVDTATAFAQAVQQRLQSGVPAPQQLARHRLAAESWAAKAQQFQQWIDGDE